MYTVNLKDRYGNRLISTADIKQSYDASSEKAMSGTAVAEAINAAKLTDYIQSINGSEGIVDVKILDERGDNTTDLDIWSNKVESTLENGVLNVVVKETKIENGWVKKFRDSEFFDDTKEYIIDNDKKLKIIEKDGSTTDVVNVDLTKITDGTDMFYGLNLAVNFYGSFANLINGNAMFKAYIEKAPTVEGLDDVSAVKGPLFPSLTDGRSMFYNNKNHKKINFDNMPMLRNGDGMFYQNSIQRFYGSLSNVTCAEGMFYNNMAYESDFVFNSDLSNLKNGDRMFGSSNLNGFNSNLNSLQSANHMFAGTNLSSFKTNSLKNLENGDSMFFYCNMSSFNYDMPNLTFGQQMFYRRTRFSQLNYV